ncbi:ABC transporter substrate-binding protein [Geodermatophilus nigrescens]|uniref:Branched-chain amino acid transport system substrate-binding protein n=1 Tax=Geodermatophilus nigrescens TaxID=1070870 RepID=A0A1M5LNQ8_9ACTN|nr:ABC transporter substrate-binding protein [Geodermatophilus nigrescens]SHG66691.1 branched-chain amino acid transport system substrate-binding protein [Geodermatophilus nigrescens]
MRTRKTLAGCAALAVTLTACSQPAADTDTSGGLSGDPVVLGVQSQDTGPSAYPQSTYGAEAAEWYVNNELGGIGGRPLELDVCSGDGTPETGVSCANGFVSSDVPVVFDAYDQASVGAMTPILGEAGIPIVGTLAGQGVAEAAEYGTAFYFSGPLETSALGMVTVLADQGASTAALAVNDVPSSHGYVDDLVKPLAGELGLDVTGVYTTVDNLNYQVLAQTELAGEPDVAGVISLPEEACTGLVQALRQNGFEGTVFAGSCSQFIEQLAGEAAGAIVQPRLWVPRSYDNAPAEVQEQLDAFAEAMEAVGYEDEQSARSLYSFAGIVNLANILDEVEGELTAQAVTDAMKGVRDLPSFLGPEVTCDGEQWPGRPGACSHEAIFFEVQDDGTLAPVSEDGFTELDTAVAERVVGT